MNKILKSGLFVLFVSVALMGASNAFFSDTETSLNNNIQIDTLDLKINNQDNPEAIVNINGQKPGQNQIVEKQLRVLGSPAKIYLHLKELVSSQGEQTEPETEEEQQNGEKFDLENHIIYDLKIADEIIIEGSDDVLLSEALSCWIPLGTFSADEARILEQSFHLPSVLTNWIQGDKTTFVEEFLALQIEDPSPPDTGTGRSWDANSKKCVGAEFLSPTPTPTPVNRPHFYITGSLSAEEFDGVDRTYSVFLNTEGLPIDELQAVVYIDPTFFNFVQFNATHPSSICVSQWTTTLPSTNGITSLVTTPLFENNYAVFTCDLIDPFIGTDGFIGSFRIYNIEAGNPSLVFSADTTHNLLFNDGVSVTSGDHLGIEIEVAEFFGT